VTRAASKGENERAAMHWEVLALVSRDPVNEPRVLVGVRGPDGAWLRCGHRHTEDEAYACPWEPEPYPEGATLYVRQVRTEAPRRQLGFGWAPRAGRRAR